jgi:hypothetical protein
MVVVARRRAARLTLAPGGGDLLALVERAAASDSARCRDGRSGSPHENQDQDNSVAIE